MVMGVAQVRKESVGRAATALPATASVVMVTLLFDPAEWIASSDRPLQSTAAQAKLGRLGLAEENLVSLRT
jgi:hypothetical protein